MGAILILLIISLAFLLLVDKVAFFVDLGEGKLKKDGRTKKDFLIGLIPYGYLFILIKEKYNELKD